MKSPDMLAGSLQPGIESKRGYAGAWSGNGWFAPATKNPKSQLEPASRAATPDLAAWGQGRTTERSPGAGGGGR